MSQGGSSSNGASSSGAPPTQPSASGTIGSLHTQTTPSGRLSSVRGGRTPAPTAPSSAPGVAPKLKFAPSIPAKRNKKDAPLSLLEEAMAKGAHSESTRGRGDRGGRGRGRGRPQFDMVATASGPFSLGPAQSSRSRGIVMGGGASGAHSSYTGVEAVKVEMNNALSGEDREFYGDAAVDLKFGSVTTDASAPTGLDSEDSKDMKAKEQEIEKKLKMKNEIKTFDGTEEDDPEAEEEEMPKVKLEGPSRSFLDTTSLNSEGQMVDTDQLFFFQFPSVMPSFKPRQVTMYSMASSVSSSTGTSPGSSLYSNDTDDSLLEVKPEPMDQDRPILIPDNDLLAVKTEQQEGRVGAPAGQRAVRARPAGGSGPGTPKNDAHPSEESQLLEEGKIGRLLIYKSGKVKMKVGDIIMDVSSGSECSFLQDMVVIDSNTKQAFVMGSVQRRMICVPNLTQLLNGLEASDD